MIREEAKDALFSNLNIFTYTEMNVTGQTDSIFINRSCVIRFINRIFDDFAKEKSCDCCINSPANNGGNYPLSCGECSRFYGDMFEEKKDA